MSKKLDHPLVHEANAILNNSEEILKLLGYPIHLKEKSLFFTS